MKRWLKESTKPFGPGPAHALFGEARHAVIGILFSSPDQRLHLREIARLADLPAPAIHREVNRLCAAGIIADSWEMNRRLFQANKGNVLFPWLREFVRLSFGRRSTIAKVCSKSEDLQAP